MTTINELNEQCKLVSELRDEEEVLSRHKKDVSEKLAAEEAKLLEMLAEDNLTCYNSPHGKAVVSYFTSVKTPKTPEEKKAFADFLKERGLFDTMWSINSQTLNSFYKAEVEAAKERGDSDVAIPGINHVSMSPRLSFKR